MAVQDIADPNRDITLDYQEPAQAAQAGAPGSSLAARYPGIVRAYEQFLGRMPSDAEILGQTGNGTFQPNDWRIQQSIRNIEQSPEAQQRTAQAAQPTTPEAAAPTGRTAANNPGLDAGKWTGGHSSPKYAFHEVAQKYDQTTEAGRQQTLAELQQRHPQWFSGWTISGDKLRFTGDPASLDAKWDGYNEFDAWEGSKAGLWKPSWMPTQRNGQAYVGDAGAGVGAQAAGAGGGDWFSSVVPELAAFTNDASAYTTPERPSYLQGAYQSPEFQAPGFDELASDPGYRARLMSGVQARDRMAASRGSILSGGHGKAIERYAQEFGANEYKDLYGRKFGEFQTKAGLGMADRQFNESAYQDDVVNAQTQFANRYKTYRDAIGDRFRLVDTGLNATVAGAPR